MAPRQDLVDLYLQTLEAAGQRPGTVETRRRQLVRCLIDLDPMTVTRDDLVSWLALRGWARETLKSNRSAICGFFAWLKDSGRRDDDPAEGLAPVRVGKAHPRPCPDRHVAAALAIADGDCVLMVRLAAEMGLRRAEIACVSSDDVIDDGNGRALIVHGKGGKDRVLPLADDLAAEILSRGGYAFPGRFGGHVEVSYVGKRLSRLLPDGWSAHTLRHRFATTAWLRTHDLLLVSRALGHESTATTQRYIAVPSDALRGLMAETKVSRP